MSSSTNCTPKQRSIDLLPDSGPVTVTESGQRHDQVVQLVEQSVDARRQLADARTDKQKAYYQAKGQALDRRIDELVYNLYGLSPEEVATIESTRATAPVESDVMNPDRAIEAHSSRDRKAATPDKRRTSGHTSDDHGCVSAAQINTHLEPR